MKKFVIANRASGAVLGTYVGADEDEAYAAMCFDAGYTTPEYAAEAVGKTVTEALRELSITEVVGDAMDGLARLEAAVLKATDGHEDATFTAGELLMLIAVARGASREQASA